MVLDCVLCCCVQLDVGSLHAVSNDFEKSEVPPAGLIALLSVVAAYQCRSGNCLQVQY